MEAWALEPEGSGWQTPNCTRESWAKDSGMQDSLRGPCRQV